MITCLFIYLFSAYPNGFLNSQNYTEDLTLYLQTVQLGAQGETP